MSHSSGGATEYDLAALGVPTCGEYTPEKWATALEQRDYKRFVFLCIPLPPSIFGARLISFPDSNASDDRPIDLIIVSRDLGSMTALHTKTHELAHAALGHPTVILNEFDIAHLSQSDSPETWERVLSQPTPEFLKRFHHDGQTERIKAQDRDAEQLAQQILAREIWFFQQTKNARSFGRESFEQVGRSLGIE